MSNFYCEKCGVAIIEGKDGRYVTGCKHYPADVRFDEKELNEAIKKGTKA